MQDAPSILVRTDIAYIEAACRVVAETLNVVERHIRPGIETAELDAIAEDYIRSRKARPAFKGHVVDNLVFPKSLCISVNDEVVHGIPGRRRLQEGDIVSVDCGVEKDGFYGDSARTLAVGNIDKEKQHLLDVTRQALMEGIARAVAGNRVYQIGGAIQRHVENEGFTVVRELAGHGIGRALHEDPSVPNFIPSLFQWAEFPNVKLTAGKALAIEPMVNAGTPRVLTERDGWTIRTADGKPSAHFEHTVIVQDREPLILTVAD